MNNNIKSLFDAHGRRIPTEGMRVFNKISTRYYKINKLKLNFEDILKRSQIHAGVSRKIKVDVFKSVCDKLKKQVKNESLLNCLFNGIHIPFICPQYDGYDDIGTHIEQNTLNSVAASFKSEYKKLNFKATLQGSAKLSGNISIVNNSRHNTFLEKIRKGPVAGWYFPQALQEYDINSQRAQMDTLPLSDCLSLSGALDCAAALIGSPGLLVNKEDYPPVLCLSALQHSDERLMLCFKAYGHNLEFWCMSQMLTPKLTQVSEQWTGGLTLYSNI